MPSPNRDRLTFSAEPDTARYSFAGYGRVVPAPSGIVLPGFPSPEFVGTTPNTDTLLYNQGVDPTSMPSDILAGVMAENYAVGEFIRLRFRVTGIFEAYPITEGSAIQEGMATVTIPPNPPTQQPFQYVERPMAFTIRMAAGSFPLQVDAYAGTRAGDAAILDLWRTEFTGNSLLANIGGAGAGGVKTITATLRIGRAGPLQATDFTMNAFPFRVGRFEPFTPLPWSAAGSQYFHRRNVAELNPVNPLVTGKNCIPFGATPGSGGFPSGYFSAGVKILAQSDCQWCWGKLVGIERTNSHTPPIYAG